MSAKSTHPRATLTFAPWRPGRARVGCARPLPQTMPATLRLSWDFFGPTSEPVARHFEKHLREFLQRTLVSGEPETSVSDVVSTVSLVLPEETGLEVARALRPRRVEAVSPSEPPPSSGQGPVSQPPPSSLAPSNVDGADEA